MDAPSPIDRYFQSSGLRLHYLEWGEAQRPPMLLLHAVASHAHSWDWFATAMCREYRVLAIDLRGHGDSARDPHQAYEVVDYVPDVHALVERLDLQDMVLIGGSVGGRVALVYAATHPERVSRLVIVDVGPERPLEISQRFQTNVQQGDPEYDTLEEMVERSRRRNPRAPEKLLYNNALHGTRRNTAGKLVLKRDPAIAKGFIPVNLWEYVGQIQCPSLIVLGSESTIVSPETAQRMLEILPSSLLVTIQGAGHSVAIDRPQEFEEAVRSFLA